MKHINLALKSLSPIFVISLLLLFSPTSFSGRGCCSHHGGMAECNNQTGHQMCKDGTDSPSCSCKGTKFSITKTKSTKTPTDNMATNPATTTTTTTTTKTTKGCCSRHKGVSKCNTSTHYLMCKDGTQSTNCKC